MPKGMSSKSEFVSSGQKIDGENGLGNAAGVLAARHVDRGDDP